MRSDHNKEFFRHRMEVKLEEHLEELLLEGINSGEPKKWTPETFKNLKATVRKRLAEEKS